MDDVRCRNCDFRFAGNFCPQCGQEADTRLPSVWSFFHEMFTHHVGTGGKLPRTLWRLFVTPGALTLDYFRGMRSSYLRPVRLYLIASVAFFIVAGILTQHLAAPADVGDAIHVQFDESPADSGFQKKIIDKAKLWTTLPAGVRSQLIVRGAFDYAPKVMFLLLPLFALLTLLLYRKRRQPYAAHFVFALHYHALLFFAALVAVLARSRFVTIPLAIYALGYLPIALMRVFGGRTWVTLARVAVLVLVQGFAQLASVLLLLFTNLVL
jgi:hypothetical protein